MRIDPDVYWNVRWDWSSLWRNYKTNARNFGLLLKNWKEDKEMAVTFVTNERSHGTKSWIPWYGSPDGHQFRATSQEMEISFDEEKTLQKIQEEMMAEFDTYWWLFISIDKAREHRRGIWPQLWARNGIFSGAWFLHINVYDHYTPEEEKEIFGLQEEFWQPYGLTRQWQISGLHFKPGFAITRNFRRSKNTVCASTPYHAVCLAGLVLGFLRQEWLFYCFENTRIQPLNVVD